MAWFRSPLVHVVLASCPDYEDYKRDLRLRLKAMADTESSAPGQPELLFAYLRPPGADPAAKGPARVFDAMRRDLNRRRERCVRLDPLPPGAAVEAGTPGAWLQPSRALCDPTCRRHVVLRCCQRALPLSRSGAPNPRFTCLRFRPARCSPAGAGGF